MTWTCWKVSYPTRAAATAALHIRAPKKDIRDGGELVAYRCGNHWHLGRQMTTFRRKSLTSVHKRATQGRN